MRAIYNIEQNLIFDIWYFNVFKPKRFDSNDLSSKNVLKIVFFLLFYLSFY